MLFINDATTKINSSSNLNSLTLTRFKRDNKRNIYTNKHISKQQKQQQIGNVTNTYNVNSQSLKRDCDTEIIYSMSDEQCNNICKTPNLYRSYNGTCVNSIVFNRDNSPINTVCNPKLGVLAFMFGNAQFGSANLQCNSVDPYIRDNNITLPNRLCNNLIGEQSGVLRESEDYTRAYPQIEDCKCRGNEDVLALIANTSTIRTHAVCINNNVFKVLQYNNLIY